MASPAIRTYQLAGELARAHDVTVTSTGDPGVPPPGARAMQLARGAAGARALGRFDAVIAQKLPHSTSTRLARSSTRLIFDLYSPALPEGLAWLAARQPTVVDELLVRGEALAQRVALTTGDAFICTSEPARDFWLGILGLVGRLDDAGARRDPLFRDLIDVVPFGLPDEPPTAGRRVLRGVVPGIRESDRVILWAGGIVDWSDPETLIRAVARVSEARDDVKLVFLGANVRTSASRRAAALAESLGAVGRAVFFIDWVPYSERASYLLEADLGVAAYTDAFEARFAFRARLLDYVWAALPIVTTSGDALGELVARRGLGRSVAPGDSDGFARALEELLGDAAAYEDAVAGVRRIGPELTWAEAVKPLERLLAARPSGRPPGPGIALRAQEVALRARISYGARGSAGFFAHQLRRMVGAD